MTALGQRTPYGSRQHDEIIAPIPLNIAQFMLEMLLYFGAAMLAMRKTLRKIHIAQHYGNG